ncbi:hypothetical protein AGOR_G00208850 [Albula goreensis]|uniref:EF-hand domain-containing protein n=1 Tax=Albula goreensis TaxID=1534307 RepID=A0A8T3CQS6_9TELE|nr:hypothetical protein AGOR_G00208850 [Albula goreensis]
MNYLRLQSFTLLTSGTETSHALDLLQCATISAMAQFLQWGAVVSLLSLIVLQSHAQDVAPTHPPFNARHVFNTYSSDGQSLTPDEVFDVITEEMGDYIQEMNIDLLDEFMAYADDSGNGKLEPLEYRKLVTYITKDRD